LQYIGHAFGDVLGGYRAGNEAYCFHFGILVVTVANIASTHLLATAITMVIHTQALYRIH
jgi:hypothetical protein